MNGRRRFVAVGAFISIALFVAHVPPRQLRRIGILSPGESGAAQPGPFRELLRRLGHEEGRNLVIGRRYAEGDIARLSVLAEELVRLEVELIELAVEEGSRLGLVINMKTAKALGLTMPKKFLLRANEVIQ